MAKKGTITVDPTKCAGGCGKPLYSISSGEVWHEDCWRIHRAELGAERCTLHAMCSKEALKIKNELRARFEQLKKGKDGQV